MSSEKELNQGVMKTRKDIVLVTVLTALYIICFPINPLVLTGLIKPGYYLPLHITAWIAWAIGMVLIIAPIVLFPRRGGVPKGKSFVHTTRLVDTGIYAIVRHPQYTGGIYAIFLTNFLANPHWLFGVLGVAGTVAAYIGCREEDQHLIEKFGDEYVGYMRKVPRMNFTLGIIRLLRARNNGKTTES